MSIKYIDKNNLIMAKVVNKNYMYNLELQSLHYWFKNSATQNLSIKSNNILKNVQDALNETDVPKYEFTNFIQKPHISFHDRVILKTVFEHWKIYVVHKLHTRRAIYKADYFYRKKLQKRVLNALSKNVLLKWKHIVSSTDNSISIPAISLNYKKADEHYSKFLSRRYFNYWCDYIVMVNKKKALLEKSIQFYNLYCLKKCIINWKIYVTLQRQEKDKIDEARKFYRERILKKYLNTWINICELTIRKDKMECAIMHRKNKLSVKYFYAWKMYHDSKANKLMLKERILMYSRKKLLRRYFDLFVERVNESIANKIAIENAELFYNSKLVRKALFAWREWCSKKVQTALKISEIKKTLEIKMKHRTFINWRLYVIGKKCKRRKLIAIQSFYEKKILSKAIGTLHTYTDYRKEKRIKLSYLNDKSQAIIQQLQIIYMEKWRKALYSVMQEKPKLNQAIKFRELNLTRKYFFNWKEFSRQYKLKMVRKGKLNEIANTFVVKRFISHWHSKLQDILDLREKEILAISMMEKKIIKKCFSSWKEYIAQKVKMNNDIEVAIELHKKFLLREGLKKLLRNSLHNIDSEHDTQLENIAMRLYRNFEILKEYFDRWHSLIYFKNKSKFPCQVTNDNESRFTETRKTCNDIFESLNTRLVLPEYMMEKDTVSNVYDSIINCKLPQGNWPFNLFQPF